jgi:hypothetical protein
MEIFFCKGVGGNLCTKYKVPRSFESKIQVLIRIHTLYFVLRTWYIVLYSPYLCTYSMGLTGFDSRCNHRARMQAGVCTALKDSYERQMAKLLTPWLLNLT